MFIAGLALSWAASSMALHAQRGDYALSGSRWNGLSRLLAIAGDAGVDVRTPERLDLSELDPGDGLLVIHPAQALPRSDLSAFMADGGRLAVADDFGAGEALLGAFDIHRAPPPRVPAARRLRGNRNVLIAAPRVRHPLSADVTALVTNHPQTLRHAALEAIFSLRELDGAVVLAGAVGRGRLVAIGDSSVLINNMLEFAGNRRFARNLARYLARDGRLFIAAPQSELAGAYGAVGVTDPLSGLRDGLARLASVRLPASALRASTAVMALLLLIGALNALPRRSSLMQAVSLPAVETFAGFAGRVRYFAKPGRDLLPPLLTYKLEIERRVAAQLELPPRTDLLGIEAAMRAAGHSEPDIAAARALLLDLAALALPGADRVTPKKFHDLVRSGDRTLAILQRTRARDS